MTAKVSRLFVPFLLTFVMLFSFSTFADLVFLDNVSDVEASLFSGKDISEGEANKGEAQKVIKSIYRAANIFAGIVLAVSIIMIIVGGLRYILANGDPRQAESGKMIIIYSGIGIVIALSAFVIARIFSGFEFV